jgi:hypothetical protein
MVLPLAEPLCDDIVVPETKPATEWVSGRLLPDVALGPDRAKR